MAQSPRLIPVLGLLGSILLFYFKCTRKTPFLHPTNTALQCVPAVTVERNITLHMQLSHPSQTTEREAQPKRSAPALDTWHPLRGCAVWGAFPSPWSERWTQPLLGPMSPVTPCLLFQQQRSAPAHSVSEMPCTRSKQALGTEHGRAPSDKLLITFPSCSCWEADNQPQHHSFNHSFVHSPQSSNKRFNLGGKEYRN